MTPDIPWNFGTKAETLQRITTALKHSQVPPNFYFHASDWRTDRERVLRDISNRWNGHLLAVRSSSASEDTHVASMAGVFDSVLNVDGGNWPALAAALDKVSASLREEQDQILVQTMVRDVIFSGVAMSHDAQTGAPYYVINYDDETGRTDTITGGIGTNKTVYVARNGGESLIRSSRIKIIVQAVREIEQVCGMVPIDVEFALDRAEHFYLLQVRPISARKKWKSGADGDLSAELRQARMRILEQLGPQTDLVGSRSIFGVMPDWNPAELIGATPRRLAASLFRHLISRSVWSEARGEMGYRAPSRDLMVSVCGHAYIDVRASFNSFVPARIETPLAEKLVEAWIGNLCQHPEFHDKVEFEVVQSCIDFDFDIDFERKTGGSLRGDERANVRDELRTLTCKALDMAPTGTLMTALGLLQRLRNTQAFRPLALTGANGSEHPLQRVRELLDECIMFGTRPFAIAARHAFIAEALLRSAARREAITPDRIVQFRRSMNTVSRQFGEKLRAVEQSGDSETFLNEFGHLRPGTFDIESLRYADRWQQLARLPPTSDQSGIEPFQPTAGEARAIDILLRDAGLDGINAGILFKHAACAIAGREFGKFVLSRNVSDALEWLAAWGSGAGLERSVLANISIADILETQTQVDAQDAPTRFRRWADEGAQAHTTASLFKLPALITAPDDIYVVPELRCQPNLFGSGVIRGHTICLSPDASWTPDLVGRIVCIESADPGFDWVLAAGIRGLVTKYGGTNSHMAIRCIELGIPAAIGCGDQLYSRIVDAGSLELNFDSKIVRPCHDV